MGGNGSSSPVEGDAPTRIASAARSPAQDGFAISQDRFEDGAVVVSVAGELDLATAPRLKRALGDVLGAGASRVVLDMAGVTFIDSTALGVLVGVQRGLRPDARLAIAGSGADVMNVFELTGLDSTFDMFATVDEALRWARGSEAATG
jgi:anti-sigma B factor antagonist